MQGTSFYQSDEWLATRQRVIAERLNERGEVICEYCHKPIYKRYDIILHHINELTLDNYNDPSISLNPDNLMIVHHSCHNKIHNNFHKGQHKVYIVYGSPLAGKTTYVNEHKEYGDLIIDIDRIWECITGVNHLEGKPEGLKTNVFAIRDLLYDQVKCKVGQFNKCYIVGGFAISSDRERLAAELDAELIHIDTSEEECKERIENIQNMEVKQKYKEYVNEWWRLNR